MNTNCFGWGSVDCSIILCLLLYICIFAISWYVGSSAELLLTWQCSSLYIFTFIWRRRGLNVPQCVSQRSSSRHLHCLTMFGHVQNVYRLSAEIHVSK